MDILPQIARPFCSQRQILECMLLSLQYQGTPPEADAEDVEVKGAYCCKQVLETLCVVCSSNMSQIAPRSLATRDRDLFLPLGLNLKSVSIFRKREIIGEFTARRKIGDQRDFQKVHHLIVNEHREF